MTPELAISSPRKILVALIAEGENGTVARYAAELAARLHAELILVAVAPIVPAAPTAADAFEQAETARVQQATVDQLASETLAETGAAIPASVPRVAVVTWGTQGPATVDAAREHQADLVVVPMRRRANTIAHALHDHADRYVLHHSAAPVLVVPVAE
jgi:nucleotide-binding universal stress UspA family protein